MSWQSRDTNLIWLRVHLLRVPENIQAEAESSSESKHPSTSPFSRSLAGYLLLLTTAAPGLQGSAVLTEGAVNLLRSLAVFGVALLDICTSYAWENLDLGELLVLQMCTKKTGIQCLKPVANSVSWDRREGKTYPPPSLSEAWRISLAFSLPESLAVNRLCKGFGQDKLFGELICVFLHACAVVIARRHDLRGHRVVLRYNMLG